MTNLPDFERAILGGIILENELVKDVSLLLAPADFLSNAHQKIYLAMLQLHETNRPIDPMTVVAELANQKELAMVGGAAYIADLTTDVPKQLGHHCRVVRDAAQQRRLDHLLAESAKQTKGTTSERVSRLISDLSEFQQQPVFGKSGEMFVASDRFCSTIPNEVDWMVDKVIPRGANGIIAGVPKVSKSFLATHLALALALGEPFLGFEVTRPCKVALISREDHPGLTGWRVRAIRKGMGFDSSPNLIINTRAQTDLLMLDDSGQVAQVIEQLKRHRVEFAILDVFNRLHSKDENDNQDMCMVLAQLTKIQSQAKCGLCLIHHYNKSKEGSWTERLRGSSAISGWVEWLMGVTMDDAATKTRKVEFELKAADSPDPLWYRLESDSVQKTAYIKTVDDPNVMKHEPKGKAARLIT